MASMAMSALMSALRGAGRQHLTASTVAAREAITGSHVLRLHGYNKVLRKKLPNGHFFESIPFGVGGHSWKVVCYPNGADREHDGYTSLFLKSLCPHDDPFALHATTALLQASVLDRDGKPWRTQTAEHRTFLGYEAWGWKDFVKNDDLDLVDDCLTVLCDVTVDDLPLHAEEVVTAAATPPPPEPTASAPPPPPVFDALFPEAIWSNRPTDDIVTLHVGGKRFPAHRFMLEAHSPVLKEALQYATSGQLHIAGGLDAEVFKAMLQFMNNYGPAYNEKIKVEPTIADRLLVAADEYGLEKLKLACGEALCARVDIGSVAAMLTLAERHGCASLKEACIKFLSCSGNVSSFVATDGFARLRKDCPSAAAEIVDMVVKQWP
jgi:speckle-type POZ protein